MPLAPLGSAPMRFILAPIGSEGDLYPFVAMGLVLKSRGHQVLLVHNEYFTKHLANVDLPKLPLGSAEAYLDAARDPDLWHPTRGIKVITRNMAAHIDEFYAALHREIQKEPSIILGTLFCTPARILQENIGVRLITVHLQPSAMASIYDTCQNHLGPWFPKAPRFLKKMVFGFGGRLYDRALSPSVNGLRKRLGMRPVQNIILKWSASPDGVLCLFPEWFAARQPDWPEPCALATFSDFDHGRGAIDSELLAYFANNRPFVMTHGTANFSADSFFEVAVAAAQQAKKPVALLTRDRSLLPAHLPAHVRHFEYLPFSEILPYCSGIVHHGGIGTMAQALKAACPQFVVPMAHDQFDNGARVVRMGVGASCPVTKIDAKKIATWMQLAQNGKYREQAAVYAQKIATVPFAPALVRALSVLGLQV